MQEVGAHPQPGDFGLVIVIPIHSVARQLDCLPGLPQVQFVGHDCEHRRTLHDDVDGRRRAFRTQFVPWSARVVTAVRFIHLQTESWANWEMLWSNGRGIAVRFSARLWDYIFLKRPDRIWRPPNLIYSRWCLVFRGGKQPRGDADKSPHLVAK